MSAPALAHLPDATTLLEAIAASLRAASSHDPQAQVPPACVLWTDEARAWAPLVPELRALGLPLLALGAHDPAAWTGPAIWLRCVLAGTVPAPGFDPPAAPPILHLPGVARADLRAIEECAWAVQPLAELQYRGVFWSHRNGKDHTVAGFLAAELGIAVASDSATREALQRALPQLATITLGELRRAAPLTRAWCDSQLVPDPPRQLLQWLSDPAGFQTRHTAADWAAFTTIARQTYGFSPERDGVVSACRLLAGREGAWARVWGRFREAPERYPALPDLLARARPGAGQLIIGATISEVWPQENDAAETALRDALRALTTLNADPARERLLALEAAHGMRRGWVWADLGRAPLARALQHLAAIAAGSAAPVAAATLAGVAAGYTGSGWRLDDAALRAIAAVDAPADRLAVAAALQSVYRPWLAALADAWGAHVLRGDTGDLPAAAASEAPGTCVLFVDGLRLDLAHRLAGLLAAQGRTPALSHALAAFPPVTPTAKPALAPLAGRLGPGPEFSPALDGGSSALTIAQFRKALEARGWQVLQGEATGDPAPADARAWTECGQLDSYGHGYGEALARHADGELATVAARIAALLAAGWRQVQVVTDHGWLLLPGGLPKAELPEHLTTGRKGRCARLTPGAQTGLPTLPWRWDAAERIAIAPGIACFTAGVAYDHGGLTPQEGLVPQLLVHDGAAATPATVRVAGWSGLRCRVATTGATADWQADIRRKAAAAETTLCGGPRALLENGTASLPVLDTDAEGTVAVVVLLTAEGAVVAQELVTVGG